MDNSLRQTQRTHLPGSPEVLKARLRAGTLERKRVELAAYCGHDGARTTLAPYRFRMERSTYPKVIWVQPEQLEFAVWLRGLAAFEQTESCKTCRYWGYGADCPECSGGKVKQPGREVRVRAAIAAARVVLHKVLHRRWEKHVTRRPYPHRSHVVYLRWIQTQPEWKAIQTAEAWVECPCEEHRKAGLATSWVGGPYWADGPLVMAIGNGEGLDLHLLDVVKAAARETSEAAVREAICAALIEWGLRG